MVLKADQERLKSLLRDTITLLCKNGLTFHSEFSIEAVIGITLDKDDILLVSINEQIKSDKFSLETKELSPKHDINYSETVTSTEVNASQDSNLRKRKLHIKSDENNHSDPELTREPTEWKKPEDKQPKRECSGENKNMVQDVTFIKQEVDVESLKQTSDFSDNLTSVAGSQLMPADDQERETLWEQALAFNNDKMDTSQQGSQLAVNGAQVSEQHNSMESQICPPLDSTVVKSRFFYSHPTQRRADTPRSFSCQICGQTFSQAHCVRRHILSVHQRIRYFCPCCPHSCSRQDNLRSHIRLCHSNKT